MLDLVVVATLALLHREGGHERQVLGKWLLLEPAACKHTLGEALILLVLDACQISMF